MTGSEGSDAKLGVEEVLAAERRLVQPEGDQQGPLAALCLSGGGIRSATFALGVLEALARFGLLGRFHYLSTVSGGGYIGSWLTAWRTHRRDDDAVFAALDRFRAQDGREAPEIQGLRENSNYLTPKLGVLSADTWAAVAMVARNLVLNWLVFGPLFLGLLFLPKLVASALVLFGSTASARHAMMMLTGAILLTAASASAVRGRLQASDDWLRERDFLTKVLAPMAGAAFAVTFGAYTLLPLSLPWSLVLGAVAGAACYSTGWALGHFSWTKAVDGAARREARLVWGHDLAAFAAAGATAGLLLAVGQHVASALPTGGPALAVFGPAWCMLSFAVADLAFVGLNSFALRGDQDREWLARYGGWLLAVSATLAAGSAVDLYMPRAMRWTLAEGTAYLASLGVTGAITLVLGPSRFTGATTARRASEPQRTSALVSLAALVFAACLAGALSAVDDQLVCALAGGRSTIVSGSACMPQDMGRAVMWQAVCLLAFLALALLVSLYVNVNRFSLHALYRNRLVRAFLGSARRRDVRDRRQDPFSRFDWLDNVRMADTAPMAGTSGARLFHVINMALNVVSTENLAWQERKAESFTATALATGNANVGYRLTSEYGDPHRGISLGTAMAISGAAVSPNSGYHSSPLVGMLLTLFNLRLGWWLGNPAKEGFRSEGPSPGLLPALRELAGLTDDKDKWIYLSDGGHFENLGLYEMVRRHCRFIVVSDAGCDPSGAFEDLGNAVRKVYVDFGVSIDFAALNIRARSNPPVVGFYCAMGTIRYPGDGPGDAPGRLLYIKPGYHGVEPAHVRSYAIANEAFPHESTAEQWFTESQFEAYRALGAYITELICNGGSTVLPGGMPGELDIEGLMRQADHYVEERAKADRKGAEAP